jgi:hypothetical protein
MIADSCSNYAGKPARVLSYEAVAVVRRAKDDVTRRRAHRLDGARQNLRGVSLVRASTRRRGLDARGDGHAPGSEVRTDDRVRPVPTSNGLPMRIWGYILLVLGVVFLALFAMAVMGGARLGFLPWFVSLFLVFTGWTFVKSSRGLVPTAPAQATTAAAERSASDADGERPSAAAAAAGAPATVEITMTAPAAEAIARQANRSRRIPAYIAGGMLVFFIGIGVVLGAVDNTPGEGVQFLAWFSVVGLATGVMIVGITWLSTRALVGDKRATFILRTTGPMQVAPMPFGGGAVLRLADRSFMMGGSLKEIGALRNIDSGTVEYSPRGHVILAAWDSRGTLAYSAPGYDVSSGA